MEHSRAGRSGNAREIRVILATYSDWGKSY